MIVMTCSDLLTEYSAFNDLEIKGGTEKKWTALFKHLLFCHFKAYIDLLCTKSMEI